MRVPAKVTSKGQVTVPIEVTAGPGPRDRWDVLVFEVGDGYAHLGQAPLRGRYRRGAS